MLERVVDLDHFEDVEMDELGEPPEHIMSLHQQWKILMFTDIVGC